jgi:Cu/Ag efflux pump CusA
VRTWLLALVIACRGKSDVQHSAANSTEVEIIAEDASLSAGELESRVAIPIEHVLATMPRVAHVRTKITAGTAIVTVELEHGADELVVRHDMIERLSRIGAQLPPGTTPRFGPSHGRGAILRYTLRSDRLDPVALRAWQIEVARVALQRIPGVTDVTTCGGLEGRVSVTIDPARLAAAGLAVHDVSSVLVDAPSSARALADTPIKPGIRVGDIARIADDHERQTCHAVDESTDEDIIVGTIYARPDADAITVREAVEHALAALAAATPPGARLTVLPRTKPIALAIEADAKQLAAARSSLQLTPDIEHFVIEQERAAVDPPAAIRIVPRLEADPAKVEAAARRVLTESAHVVAYRRDELGIQIRGPDLAVLKTLSDQLASRLGTLVIGRVGGGEHPVLRVAIDRASASRLGISTEALGQAIAAASDDGVRIGTVMVGSQREPLVVRMQHAAPDNWGEHVSVHGTNGVLVPLSSVVKLETSSEVTEIRREDLSRWVGVRAVGSEQALRDAMGKLAMPAGYTWRLTAWD